MKTGTVSSGHHVNGMRASQVNPHTDIDALDCTSADAMAALPYVEELVPMPDSQAAFLRLASKPHCLFLDSAMRHAQLGRYSFLAVDPFHYIESNTIGQDVLGELEQQLEGLVPPGSVARSPGLPPFQGGIAGLLGYELAASLESIPVASGNEFQLPTMAVGFYDVVLAFDHVLNRGWIISQGLPEQDPLRRRGRARQRAEQLKEWIRQPATLTESSAENAVRPADLVTQHATGELQGLTSNFSPRQYCEAVKQVVQYIHAGDVFQANLSQRLLYPSADDSIALYLRMRQRNPATFAGYFAMDEFQLVSASPERFLRLEDGQVEARPIKGTRARMPFPEADLLLAEQLLQSEKDRAENVMIVDLLRNDLSRVCSAESIRVPQLCHVEAYQYVQHLVSVVEGQLRRDAGPLELLRAAFPGGSITGAPKPRAMEIIAELEPTCRGPYCGSLGYIGFDGTVDLNILIRTVTAGRGWWQFPVGGGIVADSQPESERLETWEKAAGIIHSLQ